jgi:pimeloyl-ACP methyl ester carboxylesterase
VNHHRSGRGEPLLLIHGVGHHWQGWRPVIERLEGEFDVIAPDSPGFGRTPPLPAGVAPAIGAYVDAFQAFLAELGLERPHVAGNSMGGGIALELARRGAVRSVTAISPVGFWTRAEQRYTSLTLGALTQLPGLLQAVLLRAAGSARARDVLMAQLFRWPSRMPAEEARSMLRDSFAAPAMAGALREFGAYRFERGEELRGTPVTVAWGRYDRLLIYGRQAPRARAALPWARHVTLGAGHTPFFDDPGQVAGTIRAGAAAGARTRFRRGAAV